MSRLAWEWLQLAGYLVTSITIEYILLRWDNLLKKKNDWLFRLEVLCWAGSAVLVFFLLPLSPRICWPISIVLRIVAVAFWLFILLCIALGFVAKIEGEGLTATGLEY